MKSKYVVFIFVLVALILGGVFYLTKNYGKKDEVSGTHAKVVTPKGNNKNESGTDSEKQNVNFDSENFDTFITLLPSETLINSITFDINNDGYDDEIITVRKTGTEDFTIVPGIYNDVTGDYDRLEDIPTSISKIRTFSVSGMDVTGEHQNALVYQGVDDDDNYVMSLLLWKPNETTGELFNIGDFISDGTIFIQQVERSDSYELSLSKGECYSVWVYESEKIIDENGKEVAGQNQIQSEYKWNPVAQVYELSNKIKVTAGKLAANELSRIQDGTVETFAAFLDGLWYKTSNSDNEIRYVYYDYENKEIILLYSDTQEIYEWDDSKLRHNGIYLYTVNSDITNFQRRFDILLISVDEIKITLYDSIGLAITASSEWDGQYKKLSLQSSFEETVVEEKNIFLAELEKSDLWATVDGVDTISLKDNLYEFNFNDSVERGVYSVMKIGEYDVLEVRSTSFDSILNQYYAMEFGTKTITETVKKKNVEKVVTDYDTIIFTPVKINPDDCFIAEGKAYTFQRQQPAE
ncbi:MAG: pallilysin-related adhesin [Treponema sp.]|nr:pallilysin-related adhesin [Treponema sp.]